MGAKAAVLSKTVHPMFNLLLHIFICNRCILAKFAAIGNILWYNIQNMGGQTYEIL